MPPCGSEGAAVDGNTKQCQHAPMVRGRMVYHCKCCGKSWFMYREWGIEEFGENHKQSTFTIECPYCGEWDTDVSGVLEVPREYAPPPENGRYLANRDI